MKFINLHTHSFSNKENVVEIVNQYPQEFQENLPCYSVGIHPWHINEQEVKNDLLIIEQKLQLANCVALGECGLDKRIDIPLDLQIEVFENQLRLAMNYQKPVILHCVAAFQEIIVIKKSLKIDVPMIIHGFSKNMQTAQQLLDNGFYLSFGKYLIQNPDLEMVFRQIPIENFFLETDSSNYTIEEVYKLAATYKNIELSNLQENILLNFNKVFK